MLGDHRELIDALTAEILLLREEHSATQVFTCSPSGPCLVVSMSVCLQGSQRREHSAIQVFTCIPSGSMFSSEHVCMHKGFSWSCCWFGCANAVTGQAQQQQWVWMAFVMPRSHI